MTEPLPNCFSIWLSAAVSAFLRLSSICELPGCSGGREEEKFRAAIITQRNRTRCLPQRLFQCCLRIFSRLPSSCESRTLYTGPDSLVQLSTSASEVQFHSTPG